MNVNAGTALAVNTISWSRPFTETEIANALAAHRDAPGTFRVIGHRTYEKDGRHFLEVRSEVGGLTSSLNSCP